MGSFRQHVVFLNFASAAAVVYRVPFTWTQKKHIWKLVHAGMTLLALLLSIVGLFAVFDYHRVFHIPDLYSLHSWVGISTVGLFTFQVRITDIYTVLYEYVLLLSNIWSIEIVSFPHSGSLVWLASCFLALRCGSVTPWSPPMSGWEKPSWSSVWPPASVASMRICFFLCTCSTIRVSSLFQQ